MTNSSQNADRYHWNFGNGQELDISSTASQNQTYTVSSTIQLIAYQGTLCSDTTYGPVFIAICGCKDPNALNHNPLALIDDGSCQYPDPTVVAANVFTPNGDGVNEKFNLIVNYARSIDLVILNRWGTKMFEMKSVNSSLIGPEWNGPAWNGETESGIPVSDGVYFYKYFVEGLNGQQLEGHGFLELIR
jgi:gliding motility-associated-like protein